MRSQPKSGFTLMEVSITVVILGVISAFTIPSLVKTIEKQRERTAVIQLQTLHAANQIYFAQMKTYFDANTHDPEEVNTALKTSLIVPTDNTFSYILNSALTYTATIAWSTKRIRLNQLPLKDEAPNANPCCFSNNCTILDEC